MRNQCERAEILAGAIALGEASDVERDEYRGHVATCATCLPALGGEREIERVMATIAVARDQETWEPVLPAPWKAAAKSRNRAWRWGATAASLAIAVMLGARIFNAAGLNQAVPTPLSPVVVAFDGQRITVARGPAHRSVAENTVSHAEGAISAIRTFFVPHKALPPVERHLAASGATVAVTKHTISAPGTSDEVASSDLAPPPLEHQAESIQVASDHAIRDAAPIVNITPEAPSNAYVIGADGTSSYEVAVDQTGVATKCTITKSSGYAILDQAVCKAALKAHFSPRTIDGHPVAGIYHDAYTFAPPSKRE